tara:strand:+ start:37 stop:1302 length:1266 start_codon:yes stop_codon:yes gene_type:complete
MIIPNDPNQGPISIIDPNTGKKSYHPDDDPNRQRGDVECGSVITPTIVWGHAEVKCYGDYKHNSGRPEWDVDDAAFIWQHAKIKVPSRNMSGFPPPYDFLENMTEGPFFTVKVWKRDITNPIGEWRSMGSAQAFVIDWPNGPDGESVVISGELPIDDNAWTNIAFGPWFPASIGTRWNGIPCRRPFEELMFEVCWESMFGEALDEEDNVIIVRGAPCGNDRQYINEVNSSFDPQFDEYMHAGYREPINVLERVSSISNNPNLEYGEPHTWGDVNYNLPSSGPKKSWAPLVGPPLWNSGYAGYNGHPLDSSAIYPTPREAGGCGLPAGCDTFDCMGEPYEASYTQSFNGLYRFGPYKSVKHYNNPYNLGCPASNPQCCSQSLPPRSGQGANRNRNDSVKRPSRRASQADMTNWSNRVNNKNY